MNLVRDLTTPPFEKEKWKKEFFAAMPVSISLCLSLFFKLFPYYIKFPHFIFIAVYYILAIIFCIYLYKRSYRGSLPKCEWVLLLSALIMSMIWIYTVTTILIQMVNDSQYLLPFEVSRSFLIMTVLALGNALPDFLIDCTLSTSGYAEMALSGTIGSPVFSLLFGFGLSLIKNFSLAENKEQAFDLLTFTPSTKVILYTKNSFNIDYSKDYSDLENKLDKELQIDSNTELKITSSYLNLLFPKCSQDPFSISQNIVKMLVFLRCFGNNCLYFFYF